uniref:Kinectin 1 n=1 Tax=Chelonoidis abingdonii TaxID=106734 RepID=A0A8C0J539_CHEAB
MEFYESTYFIILIPSVVITVIFLFFWLFMKETLYDEVLAKQKRDQKFLPSKTDKKKTEKKKNKRKDAQNGNLHESDSESTPREFKLSDALIADEEHVLPVPLGLTEASSSVRERKKKEKKHKILQEEHVSKELEGSKPAGKKIEPVPVTKQPTPPSEAAGSKKKLGQKKQKNGIDDQDSKSESFTSPTKKQDPLLFQHELKQESGSGKKKVSTKKQKIDNTLVDEPLIHATTYIPLMDNSDLIPLVEKREVADVGKQDITEVIQKSGAKKLKNETDKENAEVKFKDFLLAMKSMIFTEDEALCVVELLKEKSSVIQDALEKASKEDSAAAIHQLQEKDKMLAAVKEEAAVAKDQCKQLTQELVAEKERSNLVTTKMRERINVLEKEHGTFQSKIHVSYQENQGMKMKFQQLREQMEAEIGHLKQENGILRDAVSTSTNQMESKQSSELNKLRQDCARLVNELTEKNNKLQQEELQKKNAEQTIGQLKVQQQEAERRWEEIQAYLGKRIAEHEAAQQDVQNKLVAKDNEVQSLHSKLTDTIVSKQQLEQRMLQLMEAEQKRVTAEDSVQLQVQLMEQNEALKAQLQKFHSQMAAQVQHVLTLYVLIAEKDKQIKQVEDSLVNEHANLAGKEEELKRVEKGSIINCVIYCLSIHIKDDKIRALEEQLQGQLAQVSNTREEFKVLYSVLSLLVTFSRFLKDSVTVQTTALICRAEVVITEKDEKIKTVEELLEAGLIQVANREEELKALRAENSSLKKEVQNLQIQQSEQLVMFPLCYVLRIREKDGKIKSVEELLEAEVLKVANKEKTVQVPIRVVMLPFCVCTINFHFFVLALQLVVINLLKGKEEQMKTMEALLKEKEKDIAKKRESLQVNFFLYCSDLREKNWKAMEALASTEKLLQDKVNKTAKERQQYLETVEMETRELLQKLYPKVSLPSNLSHKEWIHEFEKMASEYLQEASGSEEVKAMEQKLKEAEEMHIMLQLECEKYKAVLAETEGILQRLQSSVEEEEGKWKIKIEESQKELRQMHSSVGSLEHEIERLKEEIKEAETLKREREHLESELEKAETERSTYVSEVRELKDLLTELQKKLDDSYSEAVRQNEELNLLKTQLNDTLAKLKIDQSERQKVAGDLPKAQESLASLEREIGKAAGDANVIENSDGCSEPVSVFFESVSRGNSGLMQSVNSEK